jgi:hypothetical protein
MFVSSSEKIFTHAYENNNARARSAVCRSREVQYINNFLLKLQMKKDAQEEKEWISI